MIVCPICNHHNPEGAETCVQCGASLAEFAYRACPVCGAINAADSTFCHRCLSELAPGELELSPPLEDEALREGPGAAVEPPAAEAPTEPAASEAAEPEQEPGMAAESAEPEPEIDVAEIDAAEMVAAETTVSDAAAIEPEVPAPEPEAAVAADMAPEPAISEPPLDAELPAEPINPEPAAEAASEEVAAAEFEEIAAEGGAAALTEPEPLEAEVSVPQPAEAPLAETEPEFVAPEPEVTPEQPAAEPPAGPEPRSEGAGRFPQMEDALAGLENVLPHEVVIAEPHRVTPRPSESPAPGEERDARLFHEIAAAPAPLQEMAHLVMARPRRGIAPWLRRLLYLLVLLAALTPLFTGGSALPWVRPEGGSVSLVQNLATIPEDATVLLVFDYSPAYAGELNPMALAVVRSLAERGIHTLALSTTPAGVGVAEGVYAAVAEAAPDYTYGNSYAILGYLPGEEAGLQALSHGLDRTFQVDAVQGTAWDAMPAAGGIQSLADMDRILIFADEAQPVRYWIEQVGSRLPVRLEAIVTNRIEPLLVPYRESGQLAELLSAADGAVDYAIAGAQPYSASSDGYVAWGLVLVIVAVLANVAPAGGRGKNDDAQ